MVRLVAPGGRRVKRALGPKRAPGSREALTRTQAEAKLRRRMQEGGIVAHVDAPDPQAG